VGGQDCNFGRDVDPLVGRDNPSSDLDGHDGFSFLKVSSQGTALPASAPNWSCVKDNVTGLMWEVKTSEDGLHNLNNTYTWYNTDPAVNAGVEGIENGGVCSGSACDTQSFVAAVNLAMLCGHDDWRLPKVPEILGIVNFNQSRPLIDQAFFPNTVINNYWTELPSLRSNDRAWSLSFFGGRTAILRHSTEIYIRLVRSE